MPAPAPITHANTRPPLLCLHGALLDGGEWDPLREALAPHPAILTPNYTQDFTHAAGRARVSVSALAEYVSQFMDTLECDRLALCGHSLGGMVALQLAALRPSRISHLILMETAYRPAAGVLNGALVAASRALLPLLPWRLLRFATIKTQGRHSPRAQAYLAGALPKREPPRRREELLAALRFDGRTALRAVRAPTLIVTGARNPLTRQQARVMQAVLPGAAWVEIQCAGHLVNLDQPAETARAIARFLST